VRLSSPYDTDARWAAKGDDLYCNGYKAHVTETCEGPIIGVATTYATAGDARMLGPIHEALAARDLPPLSTTSIWDTPRWRWSPRACAAGGVVPPSIVPSR